MPGLVGIVSINGDRINPGLAQAMCNAIRHRELLCSISRALADNFRRETVFNEDGG